MHIHFVVCVCDVDVCHVMYVHMCARTRVSTHAEAREGYHVSCSLMLHLIPLRQGPTEPKAGLVPSNSQEFFSLCRPQFWAYRGMCGHHT